MQKRAAKCPRSPLPGSGQSGLAAPSSGPPKARYLDDAAGALDVHLTGEDVAYLEECYVPHPIVGAISANPPEGVVLLDEKK